MKILLFGKNGQVGRELFRMLSSQGEIIVPDRSQADFENLDALCKVVRESAADVIVNAAAYTAVDKAEEEENRAFRINADAVEVLADHARRSGSLLVYYSTDYVFDGEKSGFYTETDPTNPLNVYGRSKLAGEQAIRRSGCRHLVFRTSWVHSPHRRNFVKTIWWLAREKETLKVVSDQIGAPTSAEMIADVTALAVAAFCAGRLPEGIYHLVASGQTTWHSLACHVVESMRAGGIQTLLNTAGIRPVSTAEYPVSAQRPQNSRLSNVRLCEMLGITLPDWRFHVERTLSRLSSAGNSP